MAGVGGVKDAGCETSGDEVEFSFGNDEEIGVTGGERALLGKSVGKVFWREWNPAMAVLGLEDQEFSVDGIAERETNCFGKTCDGIKEERFIDVGVLLLPGLAAVGRLVDAGFIAFTAGHEVSGGVVEGDDAAKIEIGLARDSEARPRGAIIERAEDDAVRAGSPNSDVAGGRNFRGADATEIGVSAGGECFPLLRVKQRRKRSAKANASDGGVGRAAGGG